MKIVDLAPEHEEIYCQCLEEWSDEIKEAGGLHADNVREAIDKVQPFAVDVCSGVRTDGHLDPKKLESFFRAVRD